MHFFVTCGPWGVCSFSVHVPSTVPAGVRGPACLPLSCATLTSPDSEYTLSLPATWPSLCAPRSAHNGHASLQGLGRKRGRHAGAGAGTQA